MKKITRKSCVAEIVCDDFARLMIAIVFGVVASIFSWFRSDDLNSFLNLIAILVIMFLCIAIHILKKSKRVFAEEFYIVEDVFIRAKTISNLYRTRTSYTLKFSRSGEYSLTMPGRGEEPKDPSVDYIATKFSVAGDKFFLVMMPNKGDKADKIIKAFNQRYFTFCEEDFDFIDGRYYCKKGN